MTNRVIFDAGDIDYIVKRYPQASILNDIQMSKAILNSLPEEEIEVRFFWQDRIDAMELALDIAVCYRGDLIIDGVNKLPFEKPTTYKGFEL